MKIFTLCIILCLVCVKCKNVYRFDYTYYPELGGSIKLHVMPDTWPGANHRCIAEGSTMVWPRDKKTLDKMKAVMEANDLSRMFIGVQAIYSNGDYVSIDGIPLSKMQLKWMPGEPNNLGLNEHCLVITRDGRVADVECSTTLSYMCFKKHEKKVIKNICGTVDPEYTYNEKTNSCYKIHHEVKNWKTAYKTCYAEGAHLVIINDDVEAELVLRMIGKNFKYHDYNCRDFSETLDQSYLGLYNWEEYGWYSVYGDLAFKTTFTECDRFPAPSLYGDFCGSSDAESLKIFDTKCREKIPFICEKIPSSLDDKGVF